MPPEPHAGVTGDGLVCAQGFLRAQFPAGRLDRVLLVNPPDADASLFRFDAARRGVCPNFPPYGLVVLAEQLRREGVHVRIVNLNHEVLKASHAAASAAAFDLD